MRYVLLLMLFLVGCEGLGEWWSSGGDGTTKDTITGVLSLLPPPFNLIAETAGTGLTGLISLWIGKKTYDRVKASPAGVIIGTSD